MARSPDTPISPQKRRRSVSPPPPFHPSAGNPSTPKQRRLNGFKSTPQSLAARKAAITAALKPPSQGSVARIKSIEDELAAVAREQQIAHSGDRQLHQMPTPPSASSRKDVQGSQSQRHSDGSSTAAPTPPSPSPSSVKQIGSPVRRLAVPVLPASLRRAPSSPGIQSEAAYSITDEVRQADMEDDEIEDAVWVDPEPDLEDKQIQTDPIEDDEEFDENGMWSSQPSRAAMSSPFSSIPFTLPATGMNTDDDDDDVYFGSGASASGLSQLREPGRASGSSPASRPPQTPSSRRAGSSRAYASGGNATEFDSGARSMTSSLLTPPGSVLRDHQHAEDRAPSPTSRRGRDTSIGGPLLRGSQRQGRGLDGSPSPPHSRSSASGRERSQWQMIQDDPENPFHERAAALRAGSQAQASPAVDAAPEAESAKGLSGPLSADRVEQQIASLANLPEYIRKLERRERAAQKSAEVKAKKIAQLEEEVQRLRNTNRTLEATVAALEARR
ncbi:hypothetical protein GSI_01797 [Ganoderma sinense ZZ0214-1]|uniref:BZIP domain-containing protein n=1 Tax=Ganoderma sinense ZZ0214-1 TaxID=1077348 RepID=A0A2G8SQU2_9APHY|nr:hypothetical protein GSI_01797 [Ganoderma sinense ZZ0214-1]